MLDIASVGLLYLILSSRASIKLTSRLLIEIIRHQFLLEELPLVYTIIRCKRSVWEL